MAANLKPKPLAVSIRAAAEILSLSERSVARLLKSGKLRCSKPAGRVLIRLDDIEKMLAAHERKQ
jgi:excisionase family DNA binding protein